MKDKLLKIIRIPAVRRLLIVAVVAALTALGVASDSEHAGTLVDAVTTIASVL